MATNIKFVEAKKSSLDLFKLLLERNSSNFSKYANDLEVNISFCLRLISFLYVIIKKKNLKIVFILFFLRNCVAICIMQTLHPKFDVVPLMCFAIY